MLKGDNTLLTRDVIMVYVYTEHLEKATVAVFLEIRAQQ